MLNQKIADVEEMEHLLSTEWFNVLKQEFKEDYWKSIIEALNKSKCYLPRKKDIFNALNNCPPSKVSVVILGQDPYVHENEAHGYSFSVPQGTNIPPSLRNIFKELGNEYNTQIMPSSGCLTSWEADGVLLLNSILTVEAGLSRSHKNIGWEYFTSAIIRYLDIHNKVVFMAWGKDAQTICEQNVTNNQILTAGHPSPLNTFKPFVGCNCFKDANEILKQNDILPVRWISIFYS